MTAEEIIEILNLEPLPVEGGFFQVQHRADEVLSASCLPERYSEAHALGGTIYFLETPEQFSAMHTLITDEIYYFHSGDPLEMLILHPDGDGEIRMLGTDLAAGQRPQVCAPRGSCHGSRPIPGGDYGYSLVSTSMAPAYAEGDVVFAEREQLISSHPEFETLITSLTRLEPRTLV